MTNHNATNVSKQYVRVYFKETNARVYYEERVVQNTLNARYMAQLEPPISDVVEMTCSPGLMNNRVDRIKHLSVYAITYKENFQLYQSNIFTALITINSSNNRMLMS